MVIFSGILLILTGYILWWSRVEALNKGLEIATIYAKTLEASLTQSLRVAEAFVGHFASGDNSQESLERTAEKFKDALRYAPFLRSISELDAYGKIINSSNQSNIGVSLKICCFPPASSLTGLLIGGPWLGRDFNEAQPIVDAQPASTSLPNFVPLLKRKHRSEEKYMVLTLSPDYYLTQIAHLLEDQAGKIDVFLYDGALLFSSDQKKVIGHKDETLMKRLHIDERDKGSLIENDSSDISSSNLMAFQVSRFYPVIVLARLDIDYALEAWRNESKVLLAALAMLLVLSSIFVYVYYRRQTLLIAEQLKSEQLQRINATVFESSLEAILVTDICHRVISINPSFMRVTGYTAEEVVGYKLQDYLVSDGRSLFNSFIHELEIPKQVGHGNSRAQSNRLLSTEVQFSCKSGVPIWVEILATPEYNNQDQLIGHRYICRDITERKQMQDQVRHLAFYDPLTKLANRRLFNDRLHQIFAANKRSGYYGMLMFLDLDNFKPLNDRHGHVAGDLLLIEAANRLKGCVREIDTVARFGGDEFVVALSSLGINKDESHEQAMRIAEKIRHTLSLPYHLVIASDEKGGTIVEHQCTVSIGVVVFTARKAKEDDVLRSADDAMYKAKRSGQNKICLHEE